MQMTIPAIGVILPSSNRVVERVTNVILADYPGVDACFSRVPYGGHPANGYDLQPFLQSARMLAQAKPGIILWNATRGALLGFEPDRQLCALIEEDTGITATTTALETPRLFHRLGLTSIALLQQGDAGDGEHLVKTFAKEGISIVARRDLGIRDNFEASSVPSDEIIRQIIELAGEGPEAILIWSTNLGGHALATELSDKTKIPVFDSAAIGTIAALAKVTSQSKDFEIKGALAAFKTS
jgi:maleate isomerase